MTQPGDRPAERGGRAIRLLTLDVDGTVLTPEHTISDATREAVVAARRSGVVVVLASSRSPVGLRPILRELGLDTGWFVAYQGALVAHLALDETLVVLTETLVDQGVARAIERQAVQASLSVGRYAGSRWLVPEVDAAISWEAGITGDQPIVLTSDELDSAPAPHKLLVIAGQTDALTRLAGLASRLPSSVTATFSHPTYLEITAAGVDKANGLTTLADRLDIAMIDTAAVGDGHNDVAMFGVVGCSVAMGQAPPEVKAAATYTTSSNTADGLALALRRLLDF